MAKRQERVAEVVFFGGSRFMTIVNAALIKNFSIRVQDKSVRRFQCAELIGNGCASVMNDGETELGFLKVLTRFFDRLVLVRVDSDEAKSAGLEVFCKRAKRTFMGRRARAKGGNKNDDRGLRRRFQDNGSLSSLNDIRSGKGNRRRRLCLRR